MKLRTVLLSVLAAGVALPAFAKNGPKEQVTLVDVAVETAGVLNGLGDEAPFTINTIVAIVGGDEVLANALTRRGQRTVFAPTDEAFVNLEATLNTLCYTLFPGNEFTQLSTEAVRTVVSYHVANGRREAEEVLASDQIRTINGGFLWQSGGTLTDAVGRDSNIIFTNVFADNGVIHVIDEVVLPFVPPSACD